MSSSLLPYSLYPLSLLLSLPPSLRRESSGAQALAGGRRGAIGKARGASLLPLRPPYRAVSLVEPEPRGQGSEREWRGRSRRFPRLLSSHRSVLAHHSSLASHFSPTGHYPRLLSRWPPLASPFLPVAPLFPPAGACISSPAPARSMNTATSFSSTRPAALPAACRRSIPLGLREREDREKSGVVRMTCGGHMGPNNFIIFCVKLTCGSRGFYYFFRLNYHVSAASREPRRRHR